jgi:hypothetical protein
MLKRIGILITVGLFVIVSARIAIAITLENPGLSKFELDDYGKVTGAYWGNNPTNFLEGGELNFGIIFDTPSGITNTIWLENSSLGMSLTSYNATEKRATFMGSYGLGGGQSMAIGVEFKLQTGKPYMDIRYSVGANGVDIEEARVYFYLKPRVGSSLSRLTTPAEKAVWEMSHDAYNPIKTASSWSTGVSFPPILVAGGVLAFAIKEGEDDYESGNATTIKSKMDSGLALGNVVNQYLSNPAWGLRYPLSTIYGGPGTIDIDDGDSLFMDARLEAAPEPSTICLMLTGLFGIAGAVRRRLLK